MKKIIWLMVIILLALTWPVLAQQGSKGMGGPGAGQGPGMGMGPRGPMIYNPQTVTTVKGTVESVGSFPSTGRGGGQGMMARGVVLKTEQGSITVHLGPAWYVTEEKLPLKAGEIMEVTGSQVTQDGSTFIVAREVKADGKTLQLRDEQGLPLWRGAGRGPFQAK